MEDAMSTLGRNSTQVVIFMSSGKGHATPAVMLSRKLALLGMSITVVCTDLATKLLVETSTVCEGLDIVVTCLEEKVSRNIDSSSGDAGFSFSMEMAGVRVGVPSGFVLKFESLSQKEKLDELLSKMKSSPSPPACLIVDMMFTWTEEIASRLEIPRFVLLSGAPNQLPVFFHMRSLYEQGLLPIPLDKPELKRELLDNLRLPGLPMPIRWNDVPDAVTDSSHTFHDVHMGWHQHLLSSDGILFNTFEELEGDLFEALKSYFPRCLLLPVGPLFPEDFFRGDVRSPFLRSTEEDRCKDWLDSQPRASVVYISFGSYAVLTPEQVHELAMGIESSQQRFLWVLPATKLNHSEVLPPGFEKRNLEKGLIITVWAPQHLILSHPSLGAFLTHCGWNSTLECVTLAGVPMIGWPFFVDQQPNCRYIVDGLGIGVQVNGDERGFVSSHEVEVAVRDAMEGPNSQAMRSRAVALKSAARNAVAEGGSSCKSLGAFVSHLQ